MGTPLKITGMRFAIRPLRRLTLTVGIA